MLQTSSAKIIAPPGIGGWIQIHNFLPGGVEGVEAKGELFTVVASNLGKEGVDAITFEREIVGRLRDEYYKSIQNKPFDALRNATQKTVDEFNRLGHKLEIACCVHVKGVVYTSAYGGCKVLIKRSGSIASILESGESVVVASGMPQSDDLIIVGSSTFFEKTSMSWLSECLKNNDPALAVERLSPGIYESEQEGTAGAVIIKFEEKVEERTFQTSPPPLEENIKSHPILTKPKMLGNQILGLLKKKIPRKSIYVGQGIQDQAISHSRKLTLSIGIILLLILAVSVGFGIRQRKINSLKKEYQGLLIDATSKIELAISLASTNPEESRQLFLDSENKLLQIQSLKVKDEKVNELSKKIIDSRAAILGEYKIEPELFLDLGLLSSGFKGQDISSSGGNIFILDKEGGRVVSIAIASKKSKVVAGPTIIENPLDLASYEDNVYLLLADGVYLVGSTKSKVIEKTWVGDAWIHAFAGNIYILDKSGNQIYRYAGASGNTFGSQQNWLSSSTKPDFTDAKSWGINGSVYVLYSNAKILKYSQGSPQNFSLKGVIPEIGNIDSFYADPDNQYVYLLDRAGKRVVVIDKDGKYKAQYMSDSIGSANNLVVSEADNKIILLAGEKLLSIELKNN